jgi:Ser/Thr protein kinase RdoA (MazF antagonist)
MLDFQPAAGAMRHFQIDGELVSIEPYGNGHINDTFCAVFRKDEGRARFILQRINTHIFHDPDALMENVQRVTDHLAAQAGPAEEDARHGLTLIPTWSDRPFYKDSAGRCWRVYRFIEGARTYNTAATTDQAFHAAKAFGRFQRNLVNLPPPRLNDILPGFHDTPKRFETFECALREDVAGRAAHARLEIDFALAHRQVAHLLLNADLPERVTHNDTKLNNVLFDDATGEGICVIDLDTTMPGLVLYDFGDMVRTATSPVDEDERDLARVEMRFPMFEALLRGYLSSACSFLTAEEKQYLTVAGKLVTFEQGVRFLTDYLAGDTYYKTSRAEHNLDRCRTQFRLIESMEQQEGAMNSLITRLVDEQPG